MTPKEADEEEERAAYALWEPTLAAIAARPGTTLLAGGMDTGKTTFARLLANRLAASGGAAAVLDADLGQSEIGPPACVGLGVTTAPVRALADIAPVALAFVGATSPVGVLLEHATAMRRVADLAPPGTLIIDMGGLATGASARRLHQAAFDLLAPAHVVGLQRRGELEPILAPMRRRENCQLHLPPIPDVIQGKPPRFRAQRRAMRFAAYFENARLHTYAFEDAAFAGTWLGGGVTLAPHLLKFVSQTLGSQTRVFYGETGDQHLGLMVSQPLRPDSPELGIVLEQFRAASVSLTVAPRLKHLLLGLEGANGKLLGLGLVETLDFRRRALGVLTPLRAPEAARVLRWGGLRLKPDGTELGALKPGEI